MKKKLILIAGVVFCLALIALVIGFVFLGSIVKAGVEQAGPIITKVPVKLDAATVSPFSGSGELKGFEIGNPEGFKTPHAIKVGSVAVSVSPGSLLGDKVVVRSVRVQAPEITYETSLTENNLSKILANVKSMSGSAQPAETSSAKKALQVDEFVVTGGKIHLSAAMLGGKSATLPLPEIRLANLGQGPEGITPAALAEQALGAIVNRTLKAVSENAGELAKQGIDTATKLGGQAADPAKKLGTDGAKAVEKAGSNLRDLLKKRE